MNQESHKVIICLASNKKHKENMEVARKRLTELLDKCRFTTEHWTEPVGTLTRSDALYLNQLCTGETSLSADELNQRLKQIESDLGRSHDKRGIVTIDLDLLQHDQTRYHLRDWERSYVRDLLCEL